MSEQTAPRGAHPDFYSSEALRSFSPLCLPWQSSVHGLIHPSLSCQHHCRLILTPAARIRPVSVAHFPMPLVPRGYRAVSGFP